MSTICSLSSVKVRQFSSPEILRWLKYIFRLFSVRVVAFVIRAALAGSESAAEKLNLLIADEILFGIGYFSLIYSAYILVLDR